MPARPTANFIIVSDNIFNLYINFATVTNTITVYMQYYTINNMYFFRSHMDNWYLVKSQVIGVHLPCSGVPGAAAVLTTANSSAKHSNSRSIILLIGV